MAARMVAVFEQPVDVLGVERNGPPDPSMMVSELYASAAKTRT
jgi:hypothetical protein